MSLDDWGMGIVPAHNTCGWNIQNEIATLYPFRYSFMEMSPSEMAMPLIEGTKIYVRTYGEGIVYLPFVYRTFPIIVRQGVFR